MKQIFFTKTLIERAEKSAHEIILNLNRLGKTNGNYTGLDVQDRWFKGCLAEEAFNELLIREDKNFIRHHKTDGNSDNGDFDLIIKNRPLRVDIKENMYYENSVNFIITKLQADRHPKQPVIAVRLVEYEYAQIWGYLKLSACQIEDRTYNDYKRQVYVISYDEIAKRGAIENLLDLIDKK